MTWYDDDRHDYPTCKWCGLRLEKLKYAAAYECWNCRRGVAAPIPAAEDDFSYRVNDPKGL